MTGPGPPSPVRQCLAESWRGGGGGRGGTEISYLDHPGRSGRLPESRPPTNTSLVKPKTEKPYRRDLPGCISKISLFESTASGLARNLGAHADAW